MQTNGFVFGWSDEVQIDVNFPYPSMYINVGGSGNIVYLNTNGVPQWFPGAIGGMIYPLGARKILSSAVVNGVSRTTTATGLGYCSSNIP